MSRVARCSVRYEGAVPVAPFLIERANTHASTRGVDASSRITTTLHPVGRSPRRVRSICVAHSDPRQGPLPDCQSQTTRAG